MEKTFSKIADSMAEIPYESKVLILDNGQVVYHRKQSIMYPGDDPVWIMSNVETWRYLFDDVDENEERELRYYNDTWNDMVTAKNIYTYIVCHSYDEGYGAPNMDWATFSKEHLGIVDQYCVTERKGRHYEEMFDKRYKRNRNSRGLR